MKKLSELKENEAINVSTKKQAQKLRVQIRKQLNRDVNVYYPKTIYFKGDAIIQPVSFTGKTYPAADFLPKKTSFKKEVLKELARFDGRLFNLELDRKIQEQFNRVSCRTDENGNGILFQPDGPGEDVEQPLTELPEKWAVKVTAEILPYVQQNGVIPPYDESHIGIYAHFPRYEYGTTSPKIEPGYTLLSDEDFKRLVPDAEPKEKEIDFSVPGQLVLGSLGSIVITNGMHENDKFEGFVLRVKDGSKCNHLCRTLVKKHFKPYTGEPITLNNNG